MGKLSATAVKAATRPGKLGDGDGLYLVVEPSGTKSWMVRVQKNGNRRDFGLGGASKISLAVARERAREVRTWVELGLDPLFERRKAEGIPTFREAAAKVLAQHRATWRNEKHEKQWIRTLEAYAFPHLGNVQVNDITGPMIRNVLAEIWLAKPETARRVRQRIGTVLDWAYASGYRDSEAPMRAITKGLPRQPKKEGHYAAMAYAKVPDFIPRLRERESYSRLALEFAILTGARSGEVRHAVFDEFDLDEKLWTIPKERMKASEYEQEIAKVRGVSIRYHMNPKRMIVTDGAVTGMEFERDGSTVVVECDQVMKAIGQSFAPDSAGNIALDGGRIAVDEEGKTSMAKVWAGGDCVNAGDDLTVTAVSQGRDAAESIHRALSA